MAFPQATRSLLTSTTPRFSRFTSARIALVSRHPTRPSVTCPRAYSSKSALSPGPSPPRLPKDEQELFETLQRKSTGAFSTPREEAAPSRIEEPQRAEEQGTSGPHAQPPGKSIAATGDGKELHPDVRRGARPEFEGNVNPRTGEVGGPKNEPLRWGGGGEWSYNGRTTDF